MFEVRYVENTYGVGMNQSLIDSHSQKSEVFFCVSSIFLGTVKYQVWKIKA